MGGGSILTGLMLGAIGSFVIDRKFTEAAAFALAGAVLTFFGFMHGEAIGIAVTPTVAVAYLIVAGFIFSLGRYPQFVAMEMPGPKPVAHPAPAE
jgi:AGZA family xanthine/uracil permease-like MFS transporter